MLMYLFVFLSDACIAFFSTRFYYALEEKQRWHAIGWGAALDFVINVNAIGASQLHWNMMGPSLLGGALGVFTSMGLPRRKQDVS